MRPNSPLDAQLLQAVLDEELVLARRLLSDGANVDVQGKHEWSALLESVVLSPYLVELLLQHGANPDLASEMGYTPLMRAAGLGRMRATRMLVEAGANLGLRDYRGLNALDMAVDERQERIIEYLKPLFAALSPQPASSPTPIQGVAPKSLTSSPPEELPKGPLNLSIPVFVSSTFRDMHAERDSLRDRVFPRVADKFPQWQLRFEMVDLRWGVDTSDAKTEREKTLLVLRVCLQELERARPFVIALLGNRYGWVPPIERVRDVFRAQGIDAEPRALSITELELRLGVLESDEAVSFRAYRREGIDWHELQATGQILPENVERFVEFDANHQRRLGDLVKDLDARHPGRVHTYPADWDQRRQAVSDLEEWERQVEKHLVEDVRAFLSERFPGGPREVDRISQERERFFLAVDQDPFLFEAEIDNLERDLLRADALANRVRVVTGPSGSGKSSLLYEFDKRARRKGLFVLSWFVGADSDSIFLDELIEEWTRALADEAGIQWPEQPPAEGLFALFQSLLRTVQLSRRVILIVDSIDRFRLLGDRPFPVTASWPENVALLVSAEENPYLGWKPFEESGTCTALERLTKQSARRLAEETCARHRRKLGVDVLDRLVLRGSIADAEGRVHPLWMSLASEALNHLTASDYERLDSAAGTDAESRLNALLLELVDELPIEVNHLYEWLLERLEQGSDAEWVRCVTGLLSISPVGLRESDLERIVSTQTGRGWDPLAFADLRRALAAHLERDDLGAFRFRRLALRTCIQERLQFQRAALHAAVAGHLNELDATDPIRVQDYFVHRIEAGHFDEAALELARAFGVADEGGDAKPGAIMLARLRDAFEDPERGLFIVEKLLTSSDLAPEERLQVCHSMGALEEVLQNTAQVEHRVILDWSVAQALREVLASGPNPVAKRTLEIRMGRLGDRMRDLGQLEDAEECHRQALDIANERLAEDPNDPVKIDDQQVELGRLAETLSQMGRKEEARSLRDQALAAGERLTELDPSTRTWMNLAIDLVWQADDRLAEGDPNASMDSVERAWNAIGQAQFHGLDVIVSLNQRSVIAEREGNVHLELGDVQRAIDCYQTSMSDRDRVLRNQPTSLEFRHNWAVIHNKLAQALRASVLKLEKRGPIARQEADAAREQGKEMADRALDLWAALKRDQPDVARYERGFREATNLRVMLEF